MKIEDLLLTKEEIPIIHETAFYLPIHPMLLDPAIMLDPNLARKVFPRAAEEWHEDLSKHTEALPEGQTKRWYLETFLSKSPKVTEEERFQKLNVCGWRGEFFPDKNGFAGGLSVTRNSGSLYFDKGDLQCTLTLCPESNRDLMFTLEKRKRFGYKDKLMTNDSLTFIHVYGRHNVDYHPAALFLRNWAILYLNEAMRQALVLQKK